MKRSKFSDEQILAIVKEGEAGRKVSDLCRTHGITEQTYYRWKAKFGGMELSEMQRLKQLEDENRRLKHIVADQTLDIQALKAVVGKKVVGPIAKRAAVGWLVEAQHASIRRGCRLVGLSTATWQYERRGRVDNRELLARLQAHAAVRPRYGYRRLHTLVAREGLVANHKRVHRLKAANPPAASATGIAW
jgi:putative transposase